MSATLNISTKRKIRAEMTTREVRQLNNARKHLLRAEQKILHRNPNAAKLVLPKSDELKPCKVFVEEYFSLVMATLQPKTITEKRHLLKLFTDWLGPRALSREMVEQYVTELHAVDWGASTKYLAGVTLKTFLNWLFDTKRITDSYTRGIPWPKEQAQVPRENYTKAEIDLLLEAAGDRAISFVVRLGYHTGFALIDCCNLCWQSVDMERGIIQKPRQKTKVEATVTFDFGSPMRAALEKQREETIRVFGSIKPGFPVCKDAFNNKISMAIMFRRLCAKAGVKYKSFHSLRATMLTELAHSDAPMAVCMNVAGLKTVSQLLAYSSPQPDKIRDAMKRLRA